MTTRVDDRPPALVPVGQRTRKQISAFELHRPRMLEEAVGLWRQLEGQAAMLAGGIDLVNAMKQGHRPSSVIDIGGLAELRRVEVGPDGGVFLGAMVTHRQLAGASLPAGAGADLARAWASIGNPRIRHKGTLGGNLMAANPAYDLMPCLTALDARLCFVDAQGAERTVPARAGSPAGAGFLTGIRVDANRTRLLFERGHKPLVSVALAARMEGDAVRELTVALGGVDARTPWATSALDRPVDLAHLGPQAASLAAPLMRALAESGGCSPSANPYRWQVVSVAMRRSIALLGAPDGDN